MAKAKQPVSIDGIEFDALLDQSREYEADVPEYPTEKGFSVSDTIVLKAETISMTLYVTDTPVTWKNRFGSGAGRVENIVKRCRLRQYGLNQYEHRKKFRCRLCQRDTHFAEENHRYRKQNRLHPE